MDDFNVVDANAVDHAMLEARAKAEERREKMPTSAAAIEEQARILEVVRDKIVERLPEEQRHPYLRRRGNNA